MAAVSLIYFKALSISMIVNIGKPLPNWLIMCGEEKYNSSLS